MRRFLQHLTEHDLLWVLLALAGCAGMWLPDFLQFSHTPALWALIGTLAGILVNAFVLMLVLWQVNITRNREALPVILYAFVVSSVPMLHTLWEAQIVVLVFQIVLLISLQTYRQPHAVNASFWCSVLVCLLTLLAPDMVFLVPVLWVLFMTERAFNLRVWLASLIGAATVGVYFLIAYFVSQYYGVQLFLEPQELVARTVLPVAPWYPFALLCFIVVDGLFFFGSTLAHFGKENHTIRSYLLALLVPFGVVSLLLFFPPVFSASLLPLLLYLLTGIAVWFFYSQKTVFAGIVFLLHIVCWLLLWGCSYTVPLS